MELTRVEQTSVMILVASSRPIGAGWKQKRYRLQLAKWDRCDGWSFRAACTVRLACAHVLIIIAKCSYSVLEY